MKSGMKAVLLAVGPDDATYLTLSRRIVQGSDHDPNEILDALESIASMIIDLGKRLEG
jgi:hypothetical protein